MLTISKLLYSGRFELRTRAEARTLSRFLAHCVPREQLVELALLELTLNAVEHGNLEIGGRRKCALIREGHFEAEIERRLAIPTYAARVVRVEMVRASEALTFFIADEGRGFAWPLLPLEPPHEGSPCGRGLGLITAAGVDLSFNPCGNIAIFRVPL